MIPHVLLRDKFLDHLSIKNSSKVNDLLPYKRNFPPLQPISYQPLGSDSLPDRL